MFIVPAEIFFEIGVRIDAREFAGFDQRCDDRSVLATAIGAGKERILSVRRNLAVILPISGRMS